MATIPTGTPVSLLPEYGERLAFPPPPAAGLYIAVHEGALRAGDRNRLTQVVALDRGQVTWLGALDERMLTARDGEPERDVRTVVAWLLGRGPYGQVIWPGELARRSGADLLTVYRKSRPWLVVGALDDGSPVGSPLNEASNPLWFTPVIEARDQLVPNAKRVQVELAHLWSFPGGSEVAGNVTRPARDTVSQALRSYFGAA